MIAKHARPKLESLESRQVPAVSFTNWHAAWSYLPSSNLIGPVSPSPVQTTVPLNWVMLNPQPLPPKVAWWW